MAISSEAVLEIRKDSKKNGTRNIKKLAEKFRISTTACRAIVMNQSHRDENYEKFKPKQKRKIVPFDLQFALDLHAQNFSFEQISELESKFSRREPFSKSRVRELITAAKKERQENIKQ